ncbi:MAG: dipeptidase [Erysipelotrichaceae bacterium]
MKLFNLHDDLGKDIIERKKESGLVSALVDIHLPKLQQGGFYCNAVACFFAGNETWNDMQEMILEANQQIENSNANFLKNNTEIAEDNINLFITVEGMCGVNDDSTSVEDKIDWLADHNVIIASLCWNDQNYLATGLGCDDNYGLTAAGKRAIKQMEKRGIILDVSHLNDKSFSEVIEISTASIMATHSNTRALRNHGRNLTDKQLLAIADKEGLVGLNAARFIVSEDLSLQTIEQLAQHAKYIADLIGCDKVALGFDFMDYLAGYENSMIVGLENATVAQNITKALQKVGFNHQEISAICYQNCLKFFKKNFNITINNN